MPTSIRKLAFSIVLLSAVAGLAAAAEPPGLPAGWTEAFVYANGIRMNYYHAVAEPGKPVIVMAHGATDIGLCWATLAEEFQADYDIYMVDARGHGLTDPPTAADTGDTGVEDLVAFVRAMKFEKPILMGHSMGSSSVMRLVAKYKDLARAAILLDPGLGVPPPAAAAPPAGEPAPGALVMRGDPASLVAQNNRPYDDLVAQCHQQTPLWAPLDCEYWALSKKQYHGNYFAGSGRGRGMRGGGNIKETLSEITVPTLILKRDAPPETRQADLEVAKALKNGKLVHIDGAGHNLHHDQRQRTVEVMKPFLASL
jgi:pimeloyl-ACP methyl ester carboxylesterase